MPTVMQLFLKLSGTAKHKDDLARIEKKSREDYSSMAHRDIVAVRACVAHRPSLRLVKFVQEMDLI